MEHRCGHLWLHYLFNCLLNLLFWLFALLDDLQEVCDTMVILPQIIQVIQEIVKHLIIIVLKRDKKREQVRHLSWEWMTWKLYSFLTNCGKFFEKVSYQRKASLVDGEGHRVPICCGDNHVFFFINKAPGIWKNNLFLETWYSWDPSLESWISDKNFDISNISLSSQVQQFQFSIFNGFFSCRSVPLEVLYNRPNKRLYTCREVVKEFCLICSIKSFFKKVFSN